MIAKIHPNSIISKKAQIAANVEIGPFCLIGDDVKINEGTILKSHIVVDGDTEIGKNNLIFPFASIGLQPQDLKFRGEKSKLVIGDNNTIREHVTIHLGTQDGAMITKVGSNCLLMVGVHIAHDCVVGDHVILANNATLAGHVQVGDHVVIGGLSAIHQFARIGQGAMIGGMSGVEADVIPYGLVMGERASLAGLNLIGMKRRNFSREEINDLRHFFKSISESENKNFLNRVNEAALQFKSQAVKEVLDFVKSETSRSFCHIKNGS